MVAWKRLPLVVQSDHGLSGGKICKGDICRVAIVAVRSEEHTSELQSLMRISYAVFCLKKKKKTSKIMLLLHHCVYINTKIDHSDIYSILANRQYVNSAHKASSM